MKIRLLSALLVLVSPALAQLSLKFEDAFPAQEDFRRPIYLDYTSADPEHYYVLEQTGKILRLPRDGSIDGRDVFFELPAGQILQPENGGHNEEGLLGMAFDPEYAETGYVYVYYSQRGEAPAQQTGNRRRGRRSFPRHSILSRFSAEETDIGRVVDPKSELVIMKIPQPYGNHNGGTILFGPDQMLYVALGDGGAANDPHENGQNKENLLASILRIDVRDATAEVPYKIPADNPFVNESASRGEIWAYGLRNPWRMSFDRMTGELWCGDVGQVTWEEIDRIVKGGNYGWNLMEATHPFPKTRELDPEVRAGLLLPVAEYGREFGISVTGGYIYRGKLIPELEGYYIYGDFQTTGMWAVKEDREAGKHEVIALGDAPALISSFAELPNGEHLLLGFAGNSFDKCRIYRILPK